MNQRSHSRRTDLSFSLSGAVGLKVGLADELTFQVLQSPVGARCKSRWDCQRALVVASLNLHFPLKSRGNFFPLLHAYERKIVQQM